MNIQTQKKSKWLVLYIEGRLDVLLSQKLEETVHDQISKGEFFILFNLEKVEYMSSSGLRVFISAMRKLKEKDGEIALCNMNASVRKILKIVDLEGMFKIYTSESEVTGE